MVGWYFLLLFSVLFFYHVKNANFLQSITQHLYNDVATFPSKKENVINFTICVYLLINLLQEALFSYTGRIFSILPY